MSINWEFQTIDVVIVAIVIIAGFLLYFWLRKISRPKLLGLSQKEIQHRWKEVCDIMKVKKEMNYKLAIIEADKLLDHILKAMNFQGDTMGDRLKVAIYRFPKLRKVIWAHRVRNQIVHEVNYGLRHGVAKLLLKLYRNALKHLRVM
ncbi:hypothetical protein HY932_01635 [Candidatus Falkowbacteria bacterium]|nr:hypothetical protein [Candidatus Falkowbacteria bacterium]